ncbi:MAG TPA: hypothetical protein VKA55_11895 [Gammaproteobacteria bacterium]|nr:hypothetical protein [Gammaproteobacteria bacterium]
MRGKVLMAAACAILAMPSASAGEDLGGAEGFRADSVTYQEGQEPAGSVTVYMGPEGRRLEGIPPRGITLVQPADGDKRWLVDPERGQFAVDRSQGKGTSIGGVLAHQPCQGFTDARRLGPDSVNGRKTTKWRCHHPAFGTVTQWFDPAIHTVIRDRSADGQIQELRGIRIGDQDPALFRFKRSEDFQEVPVIQLFQAPEGP